jgi:hypothetical protein
VDTETKLVKYIIIEGLHQGQNNCQREIGSFSKDLVNSLYLIQGKIGDIENKNRDTSGFKTEYFAFVDEYLKIEPPVPDCARTLQPLSQSSGQNSNNSLCAVIQN